MFILSASSLFWALKTRSESEQKSYEIDTLCIPGLNFNLNNAIKKDKTVQRKLVNEPKLFERNDIVIWHDVINNSISEHSTNNFRAQPIDELIGTLKEYKHRIKAIVYCQREFAPYVYSELKTSGIPIISILKDILSPRKAKDPINIAAYFKIHQPHSYELYTFDFIREKRENLEGLAKKHLHKQLSKKQKETLRKRKEQLSLVNSS